MTARLFSKTGETRGQTIELDGEAIVGRDPQNHLVIDRPLMSSRHARIFFDRADGRYVLEDLGSLNGTELDGDRVAGEERLGHLHVITFAGSYDFFFQDLERCGQRHPQPRPATAGEPDQEPPAAAEEIREVTAVDNEPVALPGFLARRADALSEQDAAAPAKPPDITSIERDPVVLPESVAQRADEARDDGDEEPPEERREKTLHEKLPVVMPGILVRRADDERTDETEQGVQLPDTVDLADIEELITSDSDARNDDLVDDLDVGLHLMVTEASGRMRRFPLEDGRNVVGRGTGAQIPLHYRDLSRRHAVVIVDGDAVRLRDLGSRNRTFIDDEPLEPDVEVEISTSTRLRFGSVEAQVIKRGEDEG